MAKSSVKKRIEITKTGKIKRRAMGLGHSRANKNRGQILRKKKKRDLNIHKEKIQRHL
jgi:ribosomal protein L35